MTEDPLAGPLDGANSDTALERYENANDNDFTFLATETTIPRLLLVPCSILQNELESDIHWVNPAAVEEILNCSLDSNVPSCRPYSDTMWAPVVCPDMRSAELRTGESNENTSRMSD